MCKIISLVVLLASFNSFAAMSEIANGVFGSGGCTVTCSTGVSWTQSHGLVPNNQEGCNTYLFSIQPGDLANRCAGGVANGGKVGAKKMKMNRR